jgi:hypothetical protein
VTALLDQPPLFAGTGSHAVTVDRVLVPYVVESAGQLLRRAAEWFTWSCSCGRTSDQSRASHWDLALRVGEGHIRRAEA